MKKILVIILLTAFLGPFVYGQDTGRMTQEEYIAKHKDFAMNEMRLFKIPASITLAQGMLETEYGNSLLLKKSNNHFGIKCKESWLCPCVTHSDDTPTDSFRVYTSTEQSYRDHSLFLKRKQYAPLFKLNMYNYKAWAFGLKKYHYATNPQYPILLLQYIEKYRLQKYDIEAMQHYSVNKLSPK